MQEIVNKLNLAKKQQNLTLKELADKSGISLGTINKIMSGALQKIKPEKLERLANALNVSIDYLTNASVSKMVEDKRMDDMGLIKIACISPDVRVGDCQYNATQIIEQCQKAANDGVKIALFPELCVTGYSCGDLFFQSALRKSALTALNNIRNALKSLDMITIVGMPIDSDNGKMYNVACVLCKGKILGIVPKIHLPNYNEFYEKRLFTPFEGDNTTVTVFDESIPFGSKLIFRDSECNYLRFSIEICEDVWVSNSPSIAHSQAGANAIFNLSASNETISKSDYRRKMIEIQSAKCGIIYAYCSCSPSESTSQTVFSAHNIICENGELLGESLPFTTNYTEAVCDFDFIENERIRLDHSSSPNGYATVKFNLPITSADRVYSATPFVPQNKTELADRCDKTLNILAYGLKKRVEHTNVKKLVIGLSGGSDSALAFLTCVNSLKLLNRPTSDIVAVTMPCFGTTSRTLNNAITLASSYGATLKQIDISKAVTQHLKDIEHDLNDANITFENAQARERTQVLMDIANDVDGLVIGTGDMSELALGWATYNGDHMSMYGVNCSVPKTLVRALIKRCADKSSGEIKTVLLDILDTPISPELLPSNKQNHISQITEDVIGPYELHDYFLFMLIRKGFSPSKVFQLAKLSFAGKYSDETIYKWLRKFIWRFFTQQFKRSCSPDGVKLGSVDLSKLHFRMPSDACCDIWLSDLEKVNPSNR